MCRNQPRLNMSALLYPFKDTAKSRTYTIVASSFQNYIRNSKRRMIHKAQILLGQLLANNDDETTKHLVTQISCLARLEFIYTYIFIQFILSMSSGRYFWFDGYPLKLWQAILFNGSGLLYSATTHCVPTMLISVQQTSQL